MLKRGIHFTDAHPDLRLAYVEQMRLLPFEGYVAMAELPIQSDYQSTYIRLLNAMIRRRLMAAESKFAQVTFEKNSKVSQNAVREAVRNCHQALRTSNNRHPELCHVKFVGKPDFGMSVPDFLLGVLGKYLSSGAHETGGQIPRDKLMFERIRDKYRLILDINGQIEYSRRRQIAPW